jgi:hypothetical protein
VTAKNKWFMQTGDLKQHNTFIPLPFCSRLVSIEPEFTVIHHSKTPE